MEKEKIIEEISLKKNEIIVKCPFCEKNYILNIEKALKKQVKEIITIINNWMKDFEWCNRDRDLGDKVPKDYLTTPLYKKDFEELKKKIKHGKRK